MTELTVRWETRCEEAGLREEEGQIHKASCPMQGKRLSLFPIEVGARGFCS